MPSAATTAARVKSVADTFWSRLRDGLQIRDDSTDLGGTAFLATALDGDPDPVTDLSAAELTTAMDALAAVRNALAATLALERIHLITSFTTASAAVSRARTDIRIIRESLEQFRQLQTDVTDAGGQAWLETEMSAAEATKIMNAFSALTLIDTTLNAGAGSRRKALRTASD